MVISKLHIDKIEKNLTNNLADIERFISEIVNFIENYKKSRKNPGD